MCAKNSYSNLHNIKSFISFHIVYDQQHKYFKNIKIKRPLVKRFGIFRLKQNRC